MDIFVRDTVNLRLNTGIDISGYSIYKIKYQDPDGTTGEWVATLCPSSNYHILLEVDEEILVNGEWIVQAYVANADESIRLHGLYAHLNVLNLLYS